MASQPRFSSLCVFCGSSSGNQGQYRASAVALGKELCKRGIKLVYGGGSVGLMGVVSSTVALSGGSVVGIIPTALIAREISGESVGQILEVPDMHVRKEKMIALSDAFIALPGGYGTFDELLEVLTGLQLGSHTKPVGVLNIPTSTGAGYFDALLEAFRVGAQEGFIREANLGLLVSASDPAELLDKMLAFQPPPSVAQLAKDNALHPEHTVRL